MRMRAKLILSAALFGVAGLVTSGAVMALTPDLPAKAKLVKCDVSGSAATYRGALSAIAGTDQMWVRFTLQERAAGGRFERVDAPGLTTWRKSRRGVERFGYNQTVKGLEKGRAYRALVKFRWYAADGDLVRSVERRSPVCSLGGGANLTVERVRAQKGPAPGTSTYTASVENQGSTDLERVVVSLAVDGAELEAGEILLLRRGETGEVRFTGPICQTSVRAVADPRDAIAEVDEGDNVIQSSCPPTG